MGKAVDDLGVATRTTPTTTTAHPPIPTDPQPDVMTIHAEREVQLCEYVRGVCSIHGKAEKLWKPTKVWAKGNTGVFGWKYSRKAYFTCRKVTRKPTQETQPTFIAVGGAVRAADTGKLCYTYRGQARQERFCESEKLEHR